MQTSTIPDRAIEALDIYGPMIIADFGAGSGYFAISAAKKISSDGKIFAFDIQEEPLAVLRSEARAMHMHNVHTFRANLEQHKGSHLADESVDRVIIAHVLFQAPDKDAMISEAFRILKRGGKILIVEWADAGPGPEHSRRILQEVIERMLTSHHFTTDKKLALSDHHYGIIASKQ